MRPVGRRFYWVGGGADQNFTSCGAGERSQEDPGCVPASSDFVLMYSGYEGVTVNWRDRLLRQAVYALIVGVILVNVVVIAMSGAI